MFNKNVLKIIGIIATAIGIGANLTSEWVNNKSMDEKIEAKVLEALTKLGK